MGVPKTFNSKDPRIGTLAVCMAGKIGKITGWSNVHGWTGVTWVDGSKWSSHHPRMLHHDDGFGIVNLCCSVDLYCMEDGSEWPDYSTEEETDNG